MFHETGNEDGVVHLQPLHHLRSSNVLVVALCDILSGLRAREVHAYSSRLMLEAAAAKHVPRQQEQSECAASPLDVSQIFRDVGREASSLRRRINKLIHVDVHDPARLVADAAEP